MHRLLPVLKIAAILFLTVVLLLPMAHIRGLIRERQALRDQVLEDVARSDARAQTLAGPILIVPYTRTLREQQLDAQRQPVTVTREVTGELRLLPELLEVDGTLRTEERQRGIYRARVFRADAQLSGRFEVPPHYGVVEDAESYRFGRAHLALGISDIRGIGNALTLRAAGVDAAFQPGTGTALLTGGVQALLPEAASEAPRTIAYEIALSLAGTGDFNVTPVGRETNVRLASDWPHPGFMGQFLPREREVSASGFNARADVVLRHQHGGNPGTVRRVG